MSIFAPMYVIVMFCTASTPSTCREVVASDQISNPALCFTDAITFGAKWVNLHPGWEFVTARCSTELPEPDGEDL